jgi:alkanesulfonate monooxygenase SsuD/methylene tetrahydromethanopterin reductase-like flavin-dependent oxidoreductase (luciferase family)
MWSRVVTATLFADARMPRFRGVTPSLGLSIPEEMDAREGVDLAVSLETAGFSTAWFTEIERDPFVRCAATIARTDRLRVGTGIAQWTRSPVTAAMTAAELHELSAARFTFGIGTGNAFVNESFHGIPFTRPARRMAEYVKVMQGVWDARRDPFEFEGEYFSVRSFTQPYFRDRPPLILAAVGAAMLRLAARRADGVMLNPSTNPWYVRTHVVAELEAGAAQSGRSLRGLERSVCLRCSVDADRATARERARHGIAEYGRYPVHQAQYALYGFGREAEEIDAAFAREDAAAAIGAVSDEMVDTLGLAGTPDEVRRGLADWDDLIDSISLISPTFELTGDEVSANCAAIVATFGA